MSNELIKKAYEDFNGVWPYKDNFNMIARSQDGAVEFYYTSTPFDAFFHDSDLWQWVGTKADFEAYGESLKKVKWMPEVGQECEFFYGEGMEWRKGIIHCNYKQHFIIIDCEDESPFICYKHNLKPLKTEDEKQANEMFDIVKDATDTYHACELLVQGGYKKC
jgi:hypothetical protein